jgi:hypothetical protein
VYGREWGQYKPPVGALAIWQTWLVPTLAAHAIRTELVDEYHLLVVSSHPLPWHAHSHRRK